METLGPNIALWSSVATIIGLLITVVALLIAVYQTKQSKEHEGQLRLIAESVSTKEIGPFPDYLEVIAELLKRATKSVDVLCAYPEHGRFSNPKGYLKYEEAMLRVLCAPHIQADLVFADRETRINNDRVQFANAHENMDEWRQQNAENLDEYIRSKVQVAADMGIKSSSDIKSAEMWHEFQEACEQEAITFWSTRASVSLKECAELMPVFAWVIDRKEAIFAIMGYDHVLGSAIYTADKGFIDAIISLKSRYYRMCTVRAEGEQAE